MRRSKSALAINLSFPSPIEGDSGRKGYSEDDYPQEVMTHRGRRGKGQRIISWSTASASAGVIARKANLNVPFTPQTKTRTTISKDMDVDISECEIQTERYTSGRRYRCRSGYTQVKRFEDEHGNEIPHHSPKLTASIYEESQPTSARIIRPSMTIYRIQQKAMSNLANGRHCADNQITTRNTHETHTITKPLLHRSQSSFSRFSKISQLSGLKESSDGMDNTDLSSEADQEKEFNRAKITFETRIDQEAFTKCRRWMETLPRRFSGLCNVISLPDTSPGYAT